MLWSPPDRFEEALHTYQQYSDRLLATNPTKILDSLHGLIGHVRDNPAALEILLALLNKAGESTHLTEVYELLAHACVQSGELEKARDYYLKLTQLEPQNQLHARNYQQVAARLGMPSGADSLITIEEGATLVDELEASAPFIDQRYPDEIALAVRAALTDAELFASYNMPAKALGPLLAALPKAPHDLRLNQRLAALHTRAGRFAEAAVCCRNLETLYHDAGHPDEATRYGELAGKYEARASASLSAAVGTAGWEEQPEVTPELEQEPAKAVTLQPEASAPAAVASRPSGLFWHAPAAVSWPSAPQQQEAAQPEAHSTPAPESEIDLSEEWEGALSEEPSRVSTPAAADATPAHASIDDEEIIAETIAATVEEIRFYLKHGMVEQAQSALAKLKQMQPEAATLAGIKGEVNAAEQLAHASADEVSIEEVDSLAAHEDSTAAEAEPISAHSPGRAFPAASHTPKTIPAPAAVVANQPEPQQANVLGEFVAGLEDSLGDAFLPAAAQPHTGSQMQASAARSAEHKISSAAPEAFAPAAPSSMAAAATASAGNTAVAPPMFTYQTKPSAPAHETRSALEDSSLGVDVAAMFGELKQELEDSAAPATAEDSETHYNLGVAFREMGLLDEAIGEFQKVCQAADRGQTFPQLMQAYTWLAQCFLDKGVPEAAVRWYEKALLLPKLDPETRIALHYELACSFETAQNKPAALKHFLEVYGSNIDYRDVAERIKALKS